MRISEWVIGLVVLLPLSLVVSCTVHDQVLAARFQKVGQGMSQVEVVDLLGAPRDTLDCGTPGPFTERRQDCVKTYLYPSWGMPLLPSMWVVRFDARGVVIDKYRFVSW